MRGLIRLRQHPLSCAGDSGSDSPPPPATVCLVEPGAALVPCGVRPTSQPRPGLHLRPPSSSPSLQCRGSCGPTSGVTGVLFHSGCPFALQITSAFLLPKTSWKLGGKSRVPASTGRHCEEGAAGAPQCPAALPEPPLLFGADPVSFSSHELRPGLGMLSRQCGACVGVLTTPLGFLESWS